MITCTTKYIWFSVYVALFRKHFTQAITKLCGNCVRYLQYQRFDMGLRIGLYKRNIKKIETAEMTFFKIICGMYDI